MLPAVEMVKKVINESDLIWLSPINGKILEGLYIEAYVDPEEDGCPKGSSTFFFTDVPTTLEALCELFADKGNVKSGTLVFRILPLHFFEEKALCLEKKLSELI